MADYIPSEDDAFNHYAADQFVPYAVANATALGISTTDITALQNLLVEWNYAWTDYNNAKHAFHSATQDKDDNRAPLESKIRQVAQKVQANPDVTDAQKEALGITVRKKTRTPVSVPGSSPTLQKIDTSSRAILRLFFVDSNTPDSLAKPPGVASCEIRCTVGGTPPADPNQMPFLANDTRSPYRGDFEPSEIGQTAYFALRWVNTRGEPGPWSQIFSAVVPS